MSMLKIPGISYFSFLRQTRRARKTPKTVLKAGLNTQETTHSLVCNKNLYGRFLSWLNICRTLKMTKCHPSFFYSITGSKIYMDIPDLNSALKICVNIFFSN
jgi:hypothetical protein